MTDQMPKPTGLSKPTVGNDDFFNQDFSKFGQPEKNLEVSAGDLGVGLAGSAARGVGTGIAEIGLSDLLRAGAAISDKLPGSQIADVVSRKINGWTEEEQAAKKADVINKIASVTTDPIDNTIVKPVVNPIGTAIKAGGETLIDRGTSDDYKEALRGRELFTGDGVSDFAISDSAGDPAVWAAKLTDGIGSLGGTLAVGALTGGTVKNIVKRQMLKRGASMELADETARLAGIKWGQRGAMAEGVNMSTGQSADQARSQVEALSWDQLLTSKTFTDQVKEISRDPQFEGTSGTDLLNEARRRTADYAASIAKSDPKTWAAAAAGTLLGDAALFKMLQGTGAKGLAAGALQGMAGEGAGEAIEEGTQQYIGNEATNEAGGQNIDPMEGVLQAAATAGTIGALTGGAVGSVGGARGAMAPQEDASGNEVTAPDAEASNVQPSAIPAFDVAISEVQGIERKFPGQHAIGRDGDKYRAAYVDEMGNVQVTPAYGKVEDVRTAMGFKAPAQLAESAGPVSAARLSTGGPAVDEFAEIPAYQRQDGGRVKGFAEDSEVQRALAGDFGPSVAELVKRQVDAGEQGPTAQEKPFVDALNAPLALPNKDIIFAGDANAKLPGTEIAEPGAFDDKPVGPGPQYRGSERTRWQDGQEGDVLPPESAGNPPGALPGRVIDGEAREIGTELPYKPFIAGQDNRAAVSEEQLRRAEQLAMAEQQQNQPKQIGQSDTIFAPGAPGADNKNSAYTPPRLSRDQVDNSLGEQSTRDPRSPVVLAIEQAGSEQDSIFGQLKTLRITKRGKPFASQKEAQLASRKTETPIALPAGGFGVVDKAELEQVQASQASIKQLSSNDGQLEQAVSQEGTDGMPQQLPEEMPVLPQARQDSLPPTDGVAPEPNTAPATDAGVSVSGDQSVAPTEEAPQVPWSEIQDRKDGTAKLVGDTKQLLQWSKDNGIKAVASTNGVMVAKPHVAKVKQMAVTPGEVQSAAGIDEAPAPVPWDEMTNNDDGTLTLKGDVPAIKQWIKGNGIKAIPGKGGMLVATSSAPKVKAAAESTKKPAAIPEIVDSANTEVNTMPLPDTGNDPGTAEKATPALFSKKGPGLSVDVANRVADDFMREFKGRVPIKVRVAQTQEELYGPGTSKGDIGYGIEGSYSPKRGVIGLVSGVLRDERAARRVLRHEVLGHYGLDTFAPDDKKGLLQKLIDAKEEKWIAPIWKQIAGDSVYGAKSEQHQAEEVFAHIAEREPKSLGSRVLSDIKATISHLLRKVGLVKGPISQDELDHLIRSIAKGIRSGTRTKQNFRDDQDVIGTDDSDISFSLSDAAPSTRGMTKPELEMVATDWSKQYKGAADVRILVGENQAEINEVLQMVGSSVPENQSINSVYLHGYKTLLLNAEEIESPKRARELMRHELLAHHGLREVVGDDAYISIIEAVKRGKDIKGIKDAYYQVAENYTDMHPDVQAEEVFAHWIEQQPDRGELAVWWRGIVRRVKDALRAVGLIGERTTEEEFNRVLDAIATGMRNGRKPGRRVMESWHEAPAYSKSGSSGALFSLGSATAGDHLSSAEHKLNLVPPADIIDRTKSRINTLRQADKQQVKTWWSELVHKANTQVLDRLAPLKYAEELAAKSDASDSGYVAARLATGSASTMQASLLYGLPEWKDGVIQKKAGTGESDALLGIFEGLGKDLHNWLGWMAGHRAEQLMAEGRENLLTKEEIDALKQLNHGKEAAFKEAKKKWIALNKAVLDLGQEAGLFTAEDRSGWENEWYIPFFRESEDGDVAAPFKTKGIANQTAGIKKLKGGTANVNDLLENIFTTTGKMIDAAMKNMAAQKVVWNLADTDLIDVIAKPNLMDMRAANNPSNQMMWVKIDGENYLLKVNEPDLFRAMTMIDQKNDRGPAMQLAMKAKHLLTAGVTASPEFMLRNFLRDAVSAWAINDDGFRPLVDSIRGVKKTLKMNGGSIDMMFSGASFLGGYVNGNNPEAMASSVRKALRAKGMTPEQIERYEKSLIRNGKQALDVLGHYWRKYERFGEAIENGSREAVYEAAIKAGKSHAQAAFEAKDLMDFSMVGSSKLMHFLVDVLPFFNARMQGLGKLGRAIRNNPRQIAMRGGMIAAASLALLAMNWDDDRYDDLPDWDKDLNWHFWFGDDHYRIPKPFEIGLIFGTLPERMTRAMGGKDTAGKFGEVVARNMLETFSINPIPQVVKPLSEAYFNYDPFRGGPIDDMSDMNVLPEARYDERTSLLMRELGGLTGFSPKKLQHIVEGYTGTIGAYVLAAGDGVTRMLGDYGDTPSMRADEIPLLRTVYQGSAPARSSQAMTDFYKMMEEVNELHSTINQYRKEGRYEEATALATDNRAALAKRRYLTSAQKQFRALRNDMELIRRSKELTADEKRTRINNMLARRNNLAARMIRRFEAQ